MSFARMALVGFALAGCQENAAQDTPKPKRPVLVSRVNFEPVVRERTFVATIRPRIESDLGFRVPRKVALRLVSVGDAVKAEQPLATLDETDQRLQSEQADAEFGAAKAALAQAEDGVQADHDAARRGLVDGFRTRPAESGHGRGSRPCGSRRTGG
jgi:multidrug efflux pump subunit AcrA (membrane-fusion protein)